MKKIKLILVVLLISVGAFAQNVGINFDGSSPDASAMLDVKSTSKGFLPPRIALTGSTDVTTISSPATGLLIYNTATASDVTPGYYYYNGSSWIQIGLASGANQWTTSSSDIYYNSGKVGIGTSSPSYKLSVEGGAITTRSGLNNSSARPAVGTARIPGEIAGLGSADGGDDGFLRISAGAGTTSTQKSFIDLSGYSTVPDMIGNIVFGTSGSERMRINADGNVGIGTTSPAYPLHVQSSAGTGTDPGMYFNAGTSVLTPATQAWVLGIYSYYSILTNGSFVAFSDLRIKENIKEVQNSLDLVRKLRPVSYNKIDKIENGGRTEFGFIAQEVEKILPEAVNTGKGEIPVLKPFDKVEFEDGVTYTILAKNGDDIQEQKYTTADPRPEGEIIVKSKTVNDFKSLSYDMIFTVAVDAIQEQQAQIDELKQTVSELAKLLETAQNK